MAPVHGQRLNAGLLSEAGHPHAVIAFGAPAGTDLQRDRHIHRRYHRVENLGNQGLIAK